MLNFNLSEWLAITYPMFLFLCGMVIYSIFIFSFYKFLSKKDIFSLHLEKYNTSKRPGIKKTFRVIFYIIEHILLFPVLVLLWFSILTILLSFLSKNNGIDIIVMVSIALIGSVRVTAYISEELSGELSKMLPFALLGIYLVDINYVSFSNAIEKLSNIPSHFQNIVYYITLIIILELILRMFYEIYKFFKKGQENKD